MGNMKQRGNPAFEDRENRADRVMVPVSTDTGEPLMVPLRDVIADRARAVKRGVRKSARRF